MDLTGQLQTSAFFLNSRRSRCTNG